MELEKTVYLGMLLDMYGLMLTKKKRDMLSMYIDDNMSYQEIADVMNISKPAVLDSIRVAEAKLKNLEEKIGYLKFRGKVNAVLDSSNNIKEDLISLLKE